MESDNEQSTVSIVVEPDLLAKVDKRASQLDMNRSQYFRRLAREDLAKAKQKPQTVISQAA